MCEVGGGQSGCGSCHGQNPSGEVQNLKPLQWQEDLEGSLELRGSVDLHRKQAEYPMHLFYLFSFWNPSARGKLNPCRTLLCSGADAGIMCFSFLSSGGPNCG